MVSKHPVHLHLIFDNLGNFLSLLGVRLDVLNLLKA